MTTEIEFNFIPLKSIIPDPNQPRKMFDEIAEAEMVDSVKSKGILQPILLRPKGKKHMIVFGERRYRAASAAGLKNIPATIRKIDDNEALELQIVENLQRKDVHPMEEGIAFKSLLSKMQMAEIAARVGKSHAYVAQRIKLTDLIQDFQEMLFHNKINLTESLKLCRLTQASQKEILEEMDVPYDWKTDKEWDPEISWELDRHNRDLKEAPFLLEDKDLYPIAGACTVCPQNSAANRLLFPDLNEEHYCHNPACFSIKKQLHYKQQIEAVTESPDVLAVSAAWHLGKDERAKVKMAEDMGLQVIGRNDIEIMQEPAPPSEWESYKEDEKKYCSDVCDFDEEAIRAEWQSAKDNYDEYMNDIREKREAGLIKKAFVVAGSGEGRIIDIVLKSNNNASTSDDSGNFDANELEIAKINEREERNKEIDREKVYQKIAAQMKECDHYINNGQTNLTPAEMDALALLLSTFSGYDTERWLKSKTKFDDETFNWYDKFSRFERLRSHNDLKDFYRLIRRVLLDQLINNELDPGKNGSAAAIYGIAQDYIEDEIKTWETEQNEKAAKRANTVEKRIAALEEKTQSN